MSVSSLRRRAAVALAAPLAIAGLLAAGGSTAAADEVHADAQVCKDIFSNPSSCTQAVNWANNDITQTPHDDYVGMCDHIVGLAYGFAHSGSTSAETHWSAIPAVHKHPGDNSVPAGGLAFFTGGSNGHVMISVGGGRFASNDIHGNGTYTYTTIDEVHNTWGETYVGWAQPWFQANH